MKTLGELLNGVYSSNFDSMSNYAGSKEGFDHYHILTKTRDSDILTDSNWAIALERLGGEGNGVRIIRHGHWAVGWVEYLLISPTSHKLKEAEAIIEAINDYPVLSEDDYSERQSNAIYEYWNGLSLREKIEEVKSDGLSCFASRRLPGETYNRFQGSELVY